MIGTIEFFHPEETLIYHVEKSFCKVVFLRKKNCLVLEIESSEDLDHMAEDSLQNEFPKVILNIDDFPISFDNKRKLIGNTIEIPFSTVEEEDEDGEIEEIFYTNLAVGQEDYEIDNNLLKFSKDAQGNLFLNWEGEVQDFTQSTDELMKFKVKCSLADQKIQIKEDFYAESK